MHVTKPAKPLPSTFISKEIVNRRVKNYLSGKHQLLSSHLGHEDSRAGWYSLAQLEELVREMHYQNADGLRIYFGAYDQKDDLYPGQLTLIFVPTFEDPSSGQHVDIIIDDLENYADRCQSFDEKKGLDSISLCPPACGQGELSYPFDEYTRSQHS